MVSVAVSKLGVSGFGPFKPTVFYRVSLPLFGLLIL